MTTIGVRWRTLDTLYQMTQQIKHHQILEETCFSPEIKHLWGDDNDMFYWSTETMQYQRKHACPYIISCFIFWRVKNSGFVLHHGFQTRRNRWTLFLFPGAWLPWGSTRLFFQHITSNINFKWNWRRIQATHSEERGIVWNTCSWIIFVSYSVQITFLKDCSKAFIFSIILKVVWVSLAL